MKIYWSIKSIPELVGLPDTDRKIVWRESYRKASSGCRIWTWFFVYSIYGLCVVIFAKTVKNFLGYPGAFIGAVIGGALVGFVHAQIIIDKTRPFIREYLSSQKESGQV